MVWQLSLAIPAPYVLGTTFRKTYLFETSNTSRVRTHQRRDTHDNSACSRCRGRLYCTCRRSALVPLCSPTSPRRARSQEADPVVGQCREEFGGVPPEFTGGPLEFEAMWAPKIAPTEHRVLVRVHGSAEPCSAFHVRAELRPRVRYSSEGEQRNIDRELRSTPYISRTTRRSGAWRQFIAAEIRRTREAAAAEQEDRAS